MASDSSKRQALRASGTFNPRSTTVREGLFQKSAFFDPEDALQVKYEAVRAVEIDGRPLARVATDFGLSRPTLYQTQRQLHAQGLESLYPRKRGPKGAHKVTAEVQVQLRRWAQAEPELGAAEMARRLRQTLAVKIHPRTIEKTLQRQGKKGRRKSP